MTTEVAIINREAIALAADSAVTVDMINGRKIYNSANKLFALSKHHPVGIMVYGSAKLSGVPWESLIKVYRQSNPDISFERLRDYADHFFSFIESNKKYFLDEDKEYSVYTFITLVYTDIRDKIRRAIQAEFRNKSSLSKSEVNQIINGKIDDVLLFYRQSNTLRNFENITLTSLQKAYKNIFQDAIDTVFEELKITSRNNKKLFQIASYALKIDLFMPGGHSGVVIAGFGESEVIPDLITHRVDLIIGDKLRKSFLDSKSHNNRPNSILIPFAQEDVIFTFLTGISPQLETLSNYIVNTESRNALSLFFQEISQLKGISSTDVKQLHAKMEATISSISSSHRSQMQEMMQKLYINDVLDIISILPKEELAEMAESLVNLTSLRRKISIAEETVGGPTDVALISKGDGFIWIKRKHYFNKEINPDFFVRKSHLS